MTTESKSFNDVFDIDGDSNINNYPCGVDDFLSGIRKYNLSVIFMGDTSKVNTILSRNRSIFSTLRYIIKPNQNLRYFYPSSNTKYFVTSNNSRNEATNFMVNNRKFRTVFIFHTDS